MKRSRTCRITALPIVLLAAILLLFGLPVAGFAASSPSKAASSSSSAAHSASSSSSTTQTHDEGDSAGTLFATDTNLSNRKIAGDLYWADTQLTATNLTVGNDLMAGSSQITLRNAEIDGDARLVCGTLQLDKVRLGGNGTFASETLTVGKGSAAKGVYCWANDLSYEGTARYLLAYGNKIYFNGTVDGDVVLSGQEIVIGPEARVTGTLNIRSGQNLEIPPTARIANVNNALDNPNAIDLATQLRAKIAPYFQLGSIFFIIIASILTGLILLWLNSRHLNEAHRVFGEHPFGQIVLGILGVVGLVVATVICFALIFTIPAGLALLFLLLAAALLCVPFTGASIALSFKRFPRSVRVLIGAGAGGGLLFVPYVRLVVALVSLVYFFGYVLRCLFLGHDGQFNYEITHRHDGKSAADEHSEEALAPGAEETSRKARKRHGKQAENEASAGQHTAGAQAAIPASGEGAHPATGDGKEEARAALQETLPTISDEPVDFDAAISDASDDDAAAKGGFARR